MIFTDFPINCINSSIQHREQLVAASFSHNLLMDDSASLVPLKSMLEYEQGLDNGTWSVLLVMYSEASIPVFQISIDIEKPASFHYETGKKLAALRNHGIL